MNRLVGLCIVMAAAALAGCQKEQDVMSRLLVQPEVASDLGYGIQWQSSLGLPEGARILYAEVLGDRLVTLESGNILAAIRTDNGQVLWRMPIGRRGERFGRPVRQDSRLIINSASRLHTYDIDHGTVLGVVDLAEMAATSPTITPTAAIFGSAKGIVFAHDISRGYELWSYDTGAAIAANLVMAGPSLVATNANGNVIAFNPATGGVLWKQDTYGRISATPAVSDRNIFIASEDQTLYALFRQSGKQAWRYFTSDPLTRSPFTVPGMVLQPVPKQGLVALDENTGDVRWKRADLYEARPLMVVKDTLWAHRRGDVIMLDLATGETIRQVAVPGAQSIVPASPTGGDLYVIRLTGEIMKLTPR